jgi:hypothetical protein
MKRNIFIAIAALVKYRGCCAIAEPVVQSGGLTGKPESVRYLEPLLRPCGIGRDL